MNLFGKAKAAKTTPKDAIVKLREQLEVLDKRETYLQTKIDNELKLSRANASKNRRSMYDGFDQSTSSSAELENGKILMEMTCLQHTCRGHNVTYSTLLRILV